MTDNGNLTLKVIKMREPRGKILKAMVSRKDRIRELKERIRNFTEEYEDSLEYNKDLVKTYVKGFDYGLDQVKKMYPQCSLESVVLPNYVFEF